MSNENHPRPLGEPEPIEASEGSKLLRSAITVMAVTAGGLVLVSALAPVGRVRGATRSTTLQWEERRAEIQQVVNSTDAAKHEAVETGALPDPDGQ